MEPFYRHVADGMKAKFPKLEVSVEAIPLREHEKRVALALASGANNALVIELNASSAARYANNDLLPKAPANVTAFVYEPRELQRFLPRPRQPRRRRLRRAAVPRPGVAVLQPRYVQGRRPDQAAGDHGRVQQLCRETDAARRVGQGHGIRLEPAPLGRRSGRRREILDQPVPVRRQHPHPNRRRQMEIDARQTRPGGRR